MVRVLGTTGLALGLVLGLAACGSAKDDAQETAAPASEGAVSAAAASPSPEAVPEAGARPAAFAQCAACHAVEAGKNGVGPTLFGVVGRKAGTVAGYAYSDANKNSGATWDEATLDSYLTAPMKNMPGTKMAFAGIADAAKRAEVIAYLKTLK